MENSAPRVAHSRLQGKSGFGVIVNLVSDTPDDSTPAPTTGDPVAAEKLLRGTLLALLVIPAGVIVWDFIWSIGFPPGVVGVGVALGALALYRLGSGGRISVGGAVRVSVIILVTMVLAFFSGFIVDAPEYFQRALQSGRFFDALARNFSYYETGGIVINVLLVLAFTVLGVVTVFRTAATQPTREQESRPEK